MRLPTVGEKKELVEYVVNAKYVDPTPADWGEEAEYLEHIWIVVFDDYCTDGPGYAGKLMVVVWGGSPSFTETFIWQGENFHAPRKLTKVEIEI